MFLKERPAWLNLYFRKVTSDNIAWNALNL